MTAKQQLQKAVIKSKIQKPKQTFQKWQLQINRHLMSPKIKFHQNITTCSKFLQENIIQEISSQCLENF